MAVFALLLPFAFNGSGVATASSVSKGTFASSVFTTDVLPGLAAAKALGATSATSSVEVGITLANPHAAEQNAAYNAIYSPKSPLYHHFLTTKQVAADFGISSSTFDSLKKWATRDGMKVVFAPSTNEYIYLRGPASAAEKTFSVHLENYSEGSKTFFANTNGPTVPQGLDVSGVIGLNNLLASHLDQSTCEASECVGLTTPQDLWSIYDQPTKISNPKADFGQGQSMAVLGEGAVSGVISDLRAFETQNDLPEIRIDVDSVGDTFQDTSGSGEWDIDTQASTGMAPEARSETLFFANDLTDPSVLADMSAWASDPNGPNQANASFGECEENPTSPETSTGVSTPEGGTAGTAGVEFTTESENVLEQATLEGKTLFSSTGDTGSSCPVVEATVIGAGNGAVNQAFPETNYPASSPYVVAVGGTVLYGTESTATAPASNAKRFIETAWTFTGGGNTFYIAQPSYQQGIPMLDEQPCLSQPDGTPYASPTACRGIPDVSAQSGDIATNGYAVTMGGVPNEQGAGTSLSSPLWMGMWTRIQAAAKPVDCKYTLGFADPVLYKIGLNPTEDAKAFFNIGNGTASSPVTTDGLYTSLPRSPIDPSGWSYTSGLGTPNLIPLALYATGNKSLTPTRDLPPKKPKDCGQPGLNACQTGGGSCSSTGALWSNPPHTATDLFGNSDPQLSLLQGNMSLSTDGSTLQVQLTVSDLTDTVPTGAEADDWYGLWSYDGTEYFAEAQLSAVPGSAPTFGDGTVTKEGTETDYDPVNTDDTGSFTLGTNGIVEIDVPLSHVGSPSPGALFTTPAGSTFISVGVPNEESLLETVDSGGPSCNYTLGGGATNP
ncbi:MAG: S53 family peptidase [Acidimicrobiales bacterium]